MNFLFRVVSGNNRPSLSAIAAPTEAEQFESGPVRLSGPAGKDTGRSPFLPRRFFFLLRGSVSFCDIRGEWSVVPALNNAVANRNLNYCSMFLGPNACIAREGLTITLTYDEEWARTACVTCPWDPAMHNKSFLFGQVSLHGLWLTMELETMADAEAWDVAIREEMDRSYLTSHTARIHDPKAFNDLLWLLIYQGNVSLFQLYTSLTKNTAAGLSPVDRVDSLSGANIFNRLFDVANEIDRGTVEETFAFVLNKASSFDAVDRVLLLMCHISFDTCSGYHSSRAVSTSTISEPILCLEAFLSTVPKEPAVRQALLRAFQHPHKIPVLAPGRQVMSRFSLAPAVMPVVNWGKEILWFNQFGSSVLSVTSVTLEVLLRSPLCLLYLVMARTVGELNSYEFQMKEKSDSIVDIFVEILPPECLTATFEIPESANGLHFIVLLLKATHLRSQIVRGMIESRSANCMNDITFRAIVAEGLKSKAYAPLVEVVCTMLFNSTDCTVCDFCPKGVKSIPKFAITLVEVLADAQVAGEENLLQLLVSVALRAEGCSAPLVTPLSVWVDEASSAEKRNKRTATINKLLDDLLISGYLKDKCDEYLRNFGTVRVEQISVSTDTTDPGALTGPVDCAIKPLEDCILGLMGVSMLTRSDAFNSFVDEKFFDKFFGDDSRLRSLAIRQISVKFGLGAMMINKIKEHLLKECRHFSPAAMELIAFTTGEIDEDIVCGLIVVALKLQNYSNLRSRVQAAVSGLGTDFNKKASIIRLIITSIEKKSTEDVKSVTIEDLLCCVNNAVSALELLRESGPDARKLMGLFAHYLENEDVSAWLGLFKGAHTIATFIKYMNREDFSQAYTVFANLPANVANADFQTRLQVIQNDVHMTPIMSGVEIDDFMSGASTESTVKNLLGPIIARGATFRSKNTLHSNLSACIADMSVAWMQWMFASLTIPLVPKNTQIITMSLCALWLEEATKKSQCSAYIAQVGTGEGKSLIIAMIAVYCVKVLNKKVHILENNVGLRDKDYSTFCSSLNMENKTFFAALGVEGTSKHGPSATAAVSYCLRSELESYYREGVCAGRSPFQDTVLIVDEVDELIVDAQTGSNYVDEVTGKSSVLKEMFTLCERGEQSHARPEYESDEELKIMWKAACEAYNAAQGKVERKDYIRYRSGEICLLDSKRKPSKDVTLWLEYVKYKNAPATYAPKYFTDFFYQDLTHLMTRYTAIVGLSGSLGCASEREFLSETYGATCFEVPSFLDTCTGATKHKPELIDGVVQVYDTASSHSQAIVELALRKCATVPVLIVTKDPVAAAELVVKLLAKLTGNRLCDGQPAKNFVQLFCEVDHNNINMPWLDIIENATAIIPGLRNKMTTRRITVTDPFGGRGHDFMVRDEAADKNKGMAVIAAVFPDSERDWVQWKGRTARNDRHGQYAVILRADESPIKSDEALLSKYRSTINLNHHSEGLIQDLLGLRDTETLAKLVQRKDSVKQGQRLNELCDKYYGANGARGAVWPGKHKSLSVFLSERHKHTASGIRKFCKAEGLPIDSKYT